MSSIAMQGGATGSGTVTLLAPSTSTNRTINLPDSNGTILTTATAGVPVNGPAFAAQIGTNQSISAATSTKLAFSSELFDTNTNYDNSTNYRFTPTVAGYYQINLCQEFSAFTGVQAVTINKNTGRIASGGGMANNTSTWFSTASALVYLNGTTDYIEAYAYTAQASTAFAGTSSLFSGAMVRSAT